MIPENRVFSEEIPEIKDSHCPWSELTAALSPTSSRIAEIRPLEQPYIKPIRKLSDSIKKLAVENLVEEAKIPKEEECKVVKEAVKIKGVVKKKPLKSDLKRPILCFFTWSVR